MVSSSTFDEIFIQDKLEFQDSLKDLRNLRQQLYSAAEYFESSYNEEDDHQQSVLLGSSKEYFAKTLVNTIDHLGCVADKLNCFLDEKTNEILATSTRLSCIQQRLSTFRGFVDLKGVSQHTLMVEAPKHHKHYIVPPAESLQTGKSKPTCTNFIPCPQSETQKLKQENNPFAKDFRSGVIKPPFSFSRKNGPLRVSFLESSPRPANFSFKRLMSHREPEKKTGMRSGFSLRRSESVTNNRSVSLIPPDYKQRSPSVPRGAILVSYKPETTSSEREAEPKIKRSEHQLLVRYKPETTSSEREAAEPTIKRSKHQLLKALFEAHWSRK